MFSRPARAPLDAWVATLWAHERGALAHAREWNLPSGGADLVIALHDGGLRRFEGPDDSTGRLHRGGVLQGLQDRPLLRDTAAASSVVGVQFRAGGLAAWLGLPATLFTNECVGARDLLGPALDGLRERLHDMPSQAQRLDLLEAWLMSRRPAHPFATEAWLAPSVQALQQPLAPRIAQVQAASGLSPARFIQRFEQAVGMTPKRFARLARFRRLLDAAAAPGAPGWSALAADFGYADQAHLSREFRAFAGCSPTQWRPIAPDQPSHRVA